jgi:hypothetical protein
MIQVNPRPFTQKKDENYMFVSINAQNIIKNNLSASWASIVEEELGDSIEDILMTSSLQNASSVFNNHPQITDVNEILKLKYDAMKDINVLQYQSFISSNLRKFIKTHENKQNDTTIKLLIEQLIWMKTISQYLSDKIKLPIICHEKEIKEVTGNSKYIPRSSYKFCGHSYECTYNYGKRAVGCYSQHFVHNLISTDLKLLLLHININKPNDTINFIEIKKSINTMSYVINHMYEELRHIEFFNKGLSDNMHKNTTLKTNKNMKNKNMKNKKKNIRKK